MLVRKLEEWHEGAINRRGRFKGYGPKDENGKTNKKATEDKYDHINWEDHFSGKQYFGLSPVKIIQNGSGRKGVCRWSAWDIDVEIEPEEFCRIIFRINPELFCYRTSSNRWHVYYYFDNFVDVAEGRKLAQQYEDKFVKIWKKGVDTGKSLPKGFTIDEFKPGAWLFQPYCPHPDLKNNNLCSYSPSGKPLKKEQTEFAITVRKYPLLRSMVGAESGEGGREKFLFIAKMVIEHNNLDLTPFEVNEYFNEPLTEPYLTQQINRHERKDYKGEFDKNYLEEHTETYLKALNGYWRKELKGVGVLDGFTDPEQEEKAKQFLENVIYIKNDDRWYDKSTGKEYTQNAIQVTYGHLFRGKRSDVLTKFVSWEGHQLVEQSVYRPDLFKSIEDPIVKDENGLLQLNTYRPSNVKATSPDTPEVKNHIENFKSLIKKLTEHEGTGLDSKGEKFNLYDYVLDHLSMPFQQPGNKVRSAILFYSEYYQVGKNTFFSIVQKAMGKDNCAVVTPTEAIDKAKGFLEHQLVLIDEIKLDGKYQEKISTLNTMKPMMTNEDHRIRPLFHNWKDIYSTCFFMLFTNHKDAMAFDTNEARYTVINIGKTRDEMGGDEFFNLFWTPEGKLVEGVAEAVKWFLSNRQISQNFNPKSVSLKTKFLEVMSKEGGHPLLKEIEPLFKERATPFHQTVISIQDAFDWLKKHKRITGRINDLAEVLKKLGCERVGEIKHKTTGRKPTVWLLRNFDFFCDKSMSSMINEYWLPTDVSDEGKQTWNISNGEYSIIEGKLKEIDGYEQMFEGEPEEDPEEDYETIRRNRRKASKQ